MINTETTTANSATTAAAAMKQSTGLNKDDFLKLFVTQLQNQDPLNPQDGAQFIAQLAQLTQVEQSYNTNTNLQNLLNQGTNNATIASLSLIGKQVQAPGSQVAKQDGTPATMNFTLSSAAADVTVLVKDGTGAVVKTISAGAKGAGNGSVIWDGSTDAGGSASAGSYNFSVSAKDASGNTLSVSTFVRGKVDAVDLSGAVPVLSVAGITLSLSEVTMVAGGA
jgi:flagellar basal-body rod modification protein FlgD